MPVLMSSEYNLGLHIPPKTKTENGFFFHVWNSKTNEREKFAKQHNRNITWQQKRLS